MICCQDKHLTTIVFFTSLTQTHDFDPLFKVLLVIFQLGTGRHSIRLEKMILGCKFQILGIKTTVGHYIITFSRNSSCLLFERSYRAMAMSVCPSVHPRLPEFFLHALRYLFETWYTFSTWHDMSSLSFITIGPL